MQSCPTDQLYSFLLGNVLISNVQASHELLVLASFTCNILKQAFAQLFQELFGNNQFHDSVFCKDFYNSPRGIKNPSTRNFFAFKINRWYDKNETSQNPSISLVVCLLQWQTTVLMHQVLACACAYLTNCLSKKNHDWEKRPLTLIGRISFHILSDSLRWSKRSGVFPTISGNFHEGYLYPFPKK